MVNPGYREIDGRPCLERIGDIPGGVDMAVLAVANERLEQALVDAIEAGVKAVTIFASCQMALDREPRLAQRIAARAREAGLVICGGNCMGFYNLSFGLRVCGFPPPSWLRAGGAVLLTHSGSVFSALCHNDRRMAWSLVVSAGQELTTTVADYLDFALDAPQTRCVGVFIEMARDPEKFSAALAKANARDIPVIALKVGKTEASAKRAISHSGAIAGNHAAYRALFDRHNVIEVDNLDDFANALRLHSGPRRIGPGGFASVHDSGGLLELAIDRAQYHGVGYAKISDATKAALAARLDPGLEPANPLDAWGTGRDYVNAFADMIASLLNDEHTALGMLCAETRDGYYLSEGYGSALRAAFARTSKPIFVCSNFGSHGNDGVAQALSEEGIPSLSGVDSALAVVAKSLRRQERRQAPPDPSPIAPTAARAKWLARLADLKPLSETESLDLLADYGIAVAARRLAANEGELLSAVGDLPRPWVLKTAMPDIVHKTDVGGVVLDIADVHGLKRAYSLMAQRLGPRVLVAPMISGGLELALGGLVDPSFGPLVMIGAGGEYIELFKERAVALAPIGEQGALRLIRELSFQPLLQGWRGRKRVDIDALAGALAKFSVMIADLADHVSEIDVNPISVSADGCIALDALVVPARAQ
jgi:acyl-CoA synthetase (NDP forming)